MWFKKSHEEKVQNTEQNDTEHVKIVETLAVLDLVLEIESEDLGEILIPIPNAIQEK